MIPLLYLEGQSGKGVMRQTQRVRTVCGVCLCFCVYAPVFDFWSVWRCVLSLMCMSWLNDAFASVVCTCVCVCKRWLHEKSSWRRMRGVERERERDLWGSCTLVWKEWGSTDGDRWKEGDTQVGGRRSLKWWMFNLLNKKCFASYFMTYKCPSGHANPRGHYWQNIYNSRSTYQLYHTGITSNLSRQCHSYSNAM